MKVGVVGAGLIGRERLNALHQLAAEGRHLEIVGVIDPVAKPENGAVPQLNSLDDLLQRNPDWVIVATPHNVAVDLTAQALSSGAKVLVEKPMGRGLHEAMRLVNAQRFDGQLFVGMNYRFYAGIAAVASDLATGKFGSPISLALTLGHGGSPKDSESWKLDPVAAGGGALIDPGIHLLDVAQVLGGDLEVVGGSCWSGFWKTGIEEECRLIFQGERIPSVQMEVSVVRWRSTFRLELWGDKGYAIVEGRNRSYGPQRYFRGKRWGWQSGSSQLESEELVLTSDGEDVFKQELDALLFGADCVVPPATAGDAHRAMELLETCREVLKLPTHAPV